MKKLNGFPVNKKVALFLNGEKPKLIPNTNDYDIVICTDGSYSYLKDFKITPNIICGDFDSIDINSIPEGIKKIHTPDQNFTDFEKALKIIHELNYHDVDVFGASGKQQDHFIGNLNAALKFDTLLKIEFYDNYSTYYFIPNDFEVKNVLNKKISLIPFPNCEGIITNGLLYPLNNEKLTLIDRIGTRNTAIENTIRIKYKSGNLILFILND